MHEGSWMHIWLIQATDQGSLESAINNGGSLSDLLWEILRIPLQIWNNCVNLQVKKQMLPKTVTNLINSNWHIKYRQIIFRLMVSLAWQIINRWNNKTWKIFLYVFWAQICQWFCFILFVRILNLMASLEEVFRNMYFCPLSIYFIWT